MEFIPGFIPMHGTGTIWFHTITLCQAKLSIKMSIKKTVWNYEVLMVEIWKRSARETFKKSQQLRIVILHCVFMKALEHFYIL